MKKLLFVMNPFAGTRKANRYLAEILSVFNRAEYDVTVYMTACAGDGAEVVARRAGEFDLIVCAGGDGTFNETVSGVLRSGVDVPIGYIPCGSTNDFASSLHLPSDPVKAAENIVQGQSQRLDVGSFGDRFFTYVASFGAFTKASYATPQSIKNVLGHAAYILEGIQELSQIKTEHVRFETEDTVVEDDFIFGAVSNSTSVGGVLTLDPSQVNLSDGQFEVLLVRVPRDFVEIRQCIQALQSQEYNCSLISFFRAKQITVTGSPEMSWTLDGEHCPGSDTIRIADLNNGIRLITKDTL